MKTCTVIYNPLSGKKLKYEFLPKFKKILEDHGYETEIIHSLSFYGNNLKPKRIKR